MGREREVPQYQSKSGRDLSPEELHALGAPVEAGEDINLAEKLEDPLNPEEKGDN